MKTRQFIVLLIAIFLQPVICYCWFGAWADPTYREMPKHEDTLNQYKEVRDLEWKILDAVYNIGN